MRPSRLSHVAAAAPAPAAQLGRRGCTRRGLRTFSRQGLRACRRNYTQCQLTPRLTQLAFKLPALLEEARHAFGHILFGNPQTRRDVMQLVSPRVKMTASLVRR